MHSYSRFGAALVLGGCLTLAPGAELPGPKQGIVVIAHRGNHARAHENTLTALQHAIQAKVDYAELDVRRTQDGRYVLMHDATVDRTTDGNGKVAEHTFANIRRLTVRDPKRPELAPDRVPTLEEAFTVVKGKLNIYLDFKAGDRGEVAGIIRSSGMERQVIVYDAVSAVAEWRRLAPEILLIVSPPRDATTPEALVRFVKGSGVDLLDGDWGFCTKEMVAAARVAGAEVWPDIQDGRENAEYFARIFALGFSGVQTDHPEELIDWLKANGRR
jgi:glycerophosphoryl diester phosphodiesterase